MTGARPTRPWDRKGERMNLILWRHAEAEEGAEAEDLARPLTAKGHRQAHRMAEWLQARLPDRYKVIASRARRSRETARALGERFRVDEAIDPGAQPEAVLAAIGWPEAAGTVVIVGHQPTLGQVASLLLAGEAMDWSVRKGALWWISRRERGGSREVVLRAVVAPDLL